MNDLDVIFVLCGKLWTSSLMCDIAQIRWHTIDFEHREMVVILEPQEREVKEVKISTQIFRNVYNLASIVNSDSDSETEPGSTLYSAWSWAESILLYLNDKNEKMKKREKYAEQKNIRYKPSEQVQISRRAFCEIYIFIDILVYSCVDYFESLGEQHYCDIRGSAREILNYLDDKIERLGRREAYNLLIKANKTGEKESEMARIEYLRQKGL